eukprot:14146466-Alexandrium_andersonii.AAC.1
MGVGTVSLEPAERTAPEHCCSDLFAEVGCAATGDAGALRENCFPGLCSKLVQRAPHCHVPARVDPSSADE